MPGAIGGGGSKGDGGAALQQQEEARKAALREQINARFDTPDAKTRFEQEETELQKALRGHYSDELQRGYQEAERASRFGAANTGNVGGSAFADEQAKLNEQNALGGTRIEEAVQRALNNLRSSREDSRMRSISLVNSGGGNEAVQAASTGLQSALSSANSANREQIFGDLFSNLAFTKMAGDEKSRNAAAMAMFQKRTGNSYFPQQPQSGGTIVKY